MSRPAPWHKLASELANQLAEQRVESAYLERLRRFIDPEQELKALENELVGEMARSLGRTEAALVFALAELDLYGARHARLLVEQADDAAVAEAVRQFNQQRSVAERRLRDLVIQREAIGFRRNQVLYEQYPIPPRKR